MDALGRLHLTSQLTAESIIDDHMCSGNDDRNDDAVDAASPVAPEEFAQVPAGVSGVVRGRYAGPGANFSIMKRFFRPRSADKFRRDFFISKPISV